MQLLVVVFCQLKVEVTCNQGVAGAACGVLLASLKLAAATADRVVHVFDENGEKKDKFKTKAADTNSTTNYLVKGLAFSPDSTKLAIAQSDNIVFVYRCASRQGCQAVQHHIYNVQHIHRPV